MFAQTCRIESTALESRNFANSPSLPPPPLVGLPPALLGTHAVTKVSSSSSKLAHGFGTCYVCPIHVCKWMDRLTDRQVQFTRRLHDAYFHPSTDCSFRFDFDRFYSVPPRFVSFVAVRGCSFRAIQRHNLFYFRKLNGSIPTGMRRRRANGRRGESCKRRKNECERHRSRPWKFLPRYTNNFRLTEARGTVFGRNGRRSIPLSIDYLT